MINHFNVFKKHISGIAGKRVLFLGKSKSGFPNPKTDHESIKSTPWMDSSDQIQIRKLRFTIWAFFSEKKWHTTVVIYLQSYTTFKPFLRHVFCMYVVSAYAGKKKNSSALVLNSYDFTILRCILFEKRLCFNQNACISYIHS